MARLIERAQAARDGDNDARFGPADPAEVAATRAFVAYAVEHADREEKNRALIEKVLAAKRQGPHGLGGGPLGGRPDRGPAAASTVRQPSAQAGRAAG